MRLKSAIYLSIGVYILLICVPENGLAMRCSELFRSGRSVLVQTNARTAEIEAGRFSRYARVHLKDAFPAGYKLSRLIDSEGNILLFRVIHGQPDIFWQAEARISYSMSPAIVATWAKASGGDLWEPGAPVWVLISLQNIKKNNLQVFGINPYRTVRLKKTSVIEEFDPWAEVQVSPGDQNIIAYLTKEKFDELVQKTKDKDGFVPINYLLRELSNIQLLEP